LIQLSILHDTVINIIPTTKIPFPRQGHGNIVGADAYSVYVVVSTFRVNRYPPHTSEILIRSRGQTLVSHLSGFHQAVASSTFVSQNHPLASEIPTMSRGQVPSSQRDLSAQAVVSAASACYENASTVDTDVISRINPAYITGLCSP
jgi:hypothetical protein